MTDPDFADANELADLLGLHPDSHEALVENFESNYAAWLVVTHRVPAGQRGPTADRLPIIQIVLLQEKHGDRLAIHPGDIREQELISWAQAHDVTVDQVKLVFKWWHEAGRRMVRS